MSCKPSKDQLVQIGPAQPPAYWQTLNELQNGVANRGEFPGGLPSTKNGAASSGSNDTSRRDFLSLMGFSLAAAGLAGCRAPVQNAIPLLAASDRLVPGVSSFYATTCGGCASSCSLLVKQRDGRPIKIEGNAESAIFGGGTCATGQATVLSLYDDARFKGPSWKKQAVSWDEVDQRVSEGLAAAQADKRKVVLLTGTVNSPSTLEIIGEWGKRSPNFRHVAYDAISFTALRTAQQESFGRAVVPHYRFDKAKVIVGLEADFLGTWLSPVEFARQYAATRKSDANRSLHVQFESGFSVTGSNADIRVPVAPSEIGLVAAALLRRVAQKAGAQGAPPSDDPIKPQQLDAVVDELWKHRGESIVVSGSQDVSVQIAVNALNSLLDNIGKTVDLARPSLQRSGDDAALAQLVQDMNAGNVHTLIVYGVNPVYDYPAPEQFIGGLKKVALSVSFTDRLDETSSEVDAICPNHHFLESWGDAEPVDSSFSLAQPLIAPLFSTRAAQDSLLKWLGKEPNYYEYVRDHWKRNLLSRQKATQDFDTFWDRSLHDGVVELSAQASAAQPSFHGDWKAAVGKIVDAAKKSGSTSDGYEVHLYESVSMRDGRHANNPWLLELPDPITKVTWDNYAAVSPKLAAKLGIESGDVVTLKSGNAVGMQIPAMIQPGQHERTISVALGYGRKQVGKAGNNVGANAFPLAVLADGLRRYSSVGATLEKTGRHVKLAGGQGDFSFDNFHFEDTREKDIIQEVSLEELQHGESEKKEELETLWPNRLEGDHSWGLAIDINACTGCSACVVACQSENNIPVVGKDQVERRRIMHWIRVDHYYSGSMDNPRSYHQPMMCQHCQNAPCETVCPVLATTTSSEGLNQQVYNRCIGTRYCANNCPYKVRRFNWYNYTEKPMFEFNIGFDYNMQSDLGRLVLNPDVVVRSRGVMEKCSLCVQRIQLGKNIALQGKRELADGDIQTACQQACPSQAIVFGDLQDPNSRVSQLHNSQRNYRVLDSVGTRPNVGYLKKIRTTTEA
ncbi:MAG TPA: Fe-S-cluster-containing hydrogenase [Candidatus Angelobacter sp.]|nr:Fe-S-cluster-containing hydrogenase [Candidatus Angelobacter sp.]